MLIPALLCLLRLAVVTVEGDAACQFTVVEEVEPGATLEGPNLYTDCLRLQPAPGDRLTLTQPRGFGPGWELASQLVVVDDEGRLRLKRRIDRDSAEMHCPNLPECRKSFNLRLENFDRPSPVTVIQLELVIRDKNDNAPTFAPLHAPLEVTENVNDQTLQLPAVTDRDAGLNGATLTRIVSISEPSRLKVDRLSRADTAQPQLLVGPGLDYEKLRGYNITLEACDRASQRLCNTTTVQIRVLDVNDNLPKFSQREYRLGPVSESDYKSGQRVLVDRLKATDADDGENGRLVYSIVPPGGEAFDIGADGDLFLVGPLNAADQARISFDVRVSDSGATPLSDTARVIIDVLDVNDHAPEMSLQARSAAPSLRENVVNGRFAVLRVSDGDLGDNGRVDCRLTEGGDRFVMRLLPTASEAEIYALNSTRLYDREAQAQDSLTVECWDHGKPRRTVNKTFAIDIEDVNEHAPEFPDMIVYDRQVPEQLENEFVAKVTATDADATANITYRLADECLDKGHFQVDAATGTIRTLAPLDREAMTSFEGAQPVCVLTIEASDGLHTSSTRVNVKIVDINDNPPQLAEPSTLTVNETFGSHFAAFIPIGQLAYTDRDQPNTDNHRTSFRLLRTLRSPPGLNLNFTVEPDGRVSARGVLDREAAPQHLLMVALRNVGGPPVQETTATVTVRLRDLNDNPPRILRPAPNQQFNITDQQPVGATVTQIEATDADDCEPSESAIDCLRRGSLHLRLRQRVRLFEIDSGSGQLRVANALAPGRHQLSLAVTDSGAPRPHTVWLNFSVLVSAARSDRLGAGWGSGYNWTVLLIIVVASSFITVVLVVAIVLLNRRQPCFLGSSSGSGGGGGGGGGGRGGDRRRRSKGGGRQAEAAAAAAAADR
ncbi:hypothetical protein BOX15_Mlig031954g2, partial [Macrostomum lignano]